MGVVQTLAHPQSPARQLQLTSVSTGLGEEGIGAAGAGVPCMGLLHRDIGQWSTREAEHECVHTCVPVVQAQA